MLRTKRGTVFSTLCFFSLVCKVLVLHIINMNEMRLGTDWNMGFKKQLFAAVLMLVTDLFLAAGLVFTLHGRASGRFHGTENRFREASAGEALGEPKVVALTFDDGPNAKYTGILLDGLKERGVKASFFLIGECIEGNEDLVKRMDEEGHLVGVHCLYHTDLTREELETANHQLEQTKSMIEEVTGKTPEYVRPPFGNWNETLGDKVSMEPVFWNVDSVDWKLKNTSRIVNKVMKGTKNGDIILMHDEFQTSVEAALQIIDNLLTNGYTFVTVDELTID